MEKLPSKCAQGFKTVTGTQYTYEVTHQSGTGLPDSVPFHYNGLTASLADANTPCCIATAKGIAGTRVANDVFAIDWNNNRNF